MSFWSTWWRRTLPASPTLPLTSFPSKSLTTTTIRSYVSPTRHINPTSPNIHPNTLPYRQNRRQFSTQTNAPIDPPKAFQPTQGFFFNPKSTYQHDIHSRWRTYWKKDDNLPQKQITLFFLAFGYADYNHTFIIFSDRSFINPYKRPENAKHILIEEIKELEEILPMKRLEHAMKGKVTVQSLDSQERSLALDDVFNSVSEQFYFDLTVIGKLEASRAEAFQTFSRQFESTKSKPPSKSQTTLEYFYGKAAQKALQDPYKTPRFKGEELIEARRNLIRKRKEIDNKYQVVKRFKTFTSSGTCFSPVPASLDQDTQPTPAALEYANELWGYLRAKHESISVKDMLEASDVRFAKICSSIDHYPLVLRTLAQYPKQHKFFRQLEAYQNWAKMRTEQFAAWDAKNGFKVRQHALTVPGDLFEYYRGPQGVITRQVDYTMPEEASAIKLSTVADNFIPFRQPNKWDAVSLDAATQGIMGQRFHVEQPKELEEAVLL